MWICDKVLSKLLSGRSVPVGVLFSYWGYSGNSFRHLHTRTHCGIHISEVITFFTEPVSHFDTRNIHIWYLHLKIWSLKCLCIDNIMKIHSDICMYGHKKGFTFGQNLFCIDWCWVRNPEICTQTLTLTRYPNINRNYKQPCVQTLRKRSIYMNPNSNTTKYPTNQQTNNQISNNQTSVKIQTLKLQEKEIYIQTTVFKCSSQRHW